ncbi:MAG: hypothetical protein SO314_02490, partial [Alphaproteobacteria bacterium]|nr:hypothetical protein [Alphaproteobacteria bacterium]
AYCGICFLPDCQDSDTVQGDINLNINEDSEYCEKKGYTYYSSGQCPQYQAQVGKCSRDDHYLKCDAVTWCKQNGYNTTSCSLPSYLDTQCPNGEPYYKQCKEDRPRACREAGYVNSCSPGRLYATSNRCQWDSSYGKCCTASPSAGCPSNYSVNCDASRGSSGTDTCGYTCYRCCDDTCSRGSKNYSGSYAGTTECGSTCRYCSTSCSSGSTSYSGSVVGYNECGSTCRSCNSSCPSGTSTTNPGGCGGSTTNECGTRTCYYPYQSCCTPTCSDEWGCSCGTYSISNGCGGTCRRCSACCTHSSHVTCDYGCASTCPCCSSCKSCNSGTGVKSCRSEFVNVLHSYGHCQTDFAPKYYGNCGLYIKRTKTLYNGQTVVDEGYAYPRMETYSSEAECNAKARNINCYDTGYRWPYNC